MNIQDMLASVIAFFERQSALANFITIATPTVIIVAGIWRYVLNKNESKKSVSAWIAHSLGEAASRLNKAALTSAQIAIIDDQPIDFPVDYLRTLGYQVTVFQQFSLGSAASLSNYDLVILDITGVITEDIKKGGLQLIRLLKQLPNPPIVVAVSGKTYDPTVTEFFKLAEAQMKKPIAKVEFAEKVDEILSASLSPRALGQRIDELLTKLIIDSNQRRTVTYKIIRALTGRKYDSDVVNQVNPPDRARIELLIRKLLSVSQYYEVA